MILHWTPPGATSPTTSTIAPKDMSEYRPFINGVTSPGGLQGNVAVPNGQGGWDYYTPKGKIDGPDKFPPGESVTVYSNPAGTVHFPGAPNDPVAAQKMQEQLRGKLKQGPGGQAPPAPDAQGADPQGPSCSGDGQEAARNYRGNPARWRGGKPVCLIGGMPSTYNGDKPVRNGCVPQTTINSHDVCTDDSVPKPRTVCNPLFACKKDLHTALCVKATPTAFKSCLEAPDAAHDKCVVEGSPDADTWREMRETLKEICENNENGKKFFCMECSKLKTALAAAGTALPATPAGSPPPAGQGAGAIREHGGG